MIRQKIIKMKTEFLDGICKKWSGLINHHNRLIFPLEGINCHNLLLKALRNHKIDYKSEFNLKTQTTFLKLGKVTDIDCEKLSTAFEEYEFNLKNLLEEKSRAQSQDVFLKKQDEKSETVASVTLDEPAMTDKQRKQEKLRRHQENEARRLEQKNNNTSLVKPPLGSSEGKMELKAEEEKEYKWPDSKYGSFKLSEEKNVITGGIFGKTKYHFFINQSLSEQTHSDLVIDKLCKVIEYPHHVKGVGQQGLIVTKNQGTDTIFKVKFKGEGGVNAVRVSGKEQNRMQINVNGEQETHCLVDLNEITWKHA